MNENDIYKQAISKFGELSQEDKLIEEMSELTKSILKNRRKWNDIDLTHNLYEEMCDVKIVWEQIATTLDETLLQQVYLERLDNLKELLKKPNTQPHYPLF